MRFLRPVHWSLLLIMALFVSAQVWFDLEIPGYMSRITVLLNSGGTSDEIIGEGIWMIIYSVGSVFCSICAGGIAAYVASEFGKILRKEQFSKVQSFSPEEMSRFNIYSLITRSTNDVTQVQMAVARTSQLIVKVPVMVYIALTKVAVGSWEWTEVTAIGITAIVIVQIFMLWYVIPRYKRVQRFTDGMNRTVREGMSGVRVIRAFNAEEYQNRKADQTNDELTENNLYASRLLAFTRPFNGVVQNILTVAIYILGANIILASPSPEMSLTVFSNMVVFSSYVMYVVSSFILLAHIAMGLPRAIVSGKRIREVIDTEISVVSGNSTETKGKDPCISFKNVSFTYPENSNDTLTDISFDVGYGETVAIIGTTGSGKTTLLNLIPRLYDATSGTVSIDGLDVRDYDLDTLRSKIGYATQRPMLFSGTAGFNIGYGREDCSDEEMIKAAEVACIDTFLKDREGLDTKIEHLGANLSGGQKQRISIARAICKRPEIYIFDDTFSALDYRTDINVRKNIAKETSGSTILIVSQRIVTVKNADRILVLNNGMIVASGKHSELLKDCELYREMAKLQEYGGDEE
ncbi:MAG: ABC transporter ATP-binding protein/permease [Methanomassiliicoccales archaeon]|uniref:ABC transporter ATP-binding protein n=2 Tax=Candidatus Methanarcanum hacksteinii TaxID=2911857 RepID=UPI0037DD8A93|nr:ABC transporter ATP-binding protein/permease [Methanomassiliicoccales archaeon]